MTELDDFQKEVVLTAMKKMFQGSHFSICDLDKCLKITGTIPDKKDYDSLHALHCVDWKDMSPGLRQAVLERTVSMLSSDRFDLSALEMRFNNNLKCFEVQLPKAKGILSIFK